MKSRHYLICLSSLLFVLPVFTSCRAKTCDGMAGVSDDGPKRKKVKHIGLFSNKERRRKRWK